MRQLFQSMMGAARRRPGQAVLFGVIITVLVVVLIVGRFVEQPGVRLGGKSFDVIVARTVEEQRRGLSDRTKLDKRQGMLFVFDTQEKRCFWMNKMRFNLDILWFDAERRLVHHEYDLSPATFPTTYCAQAQYVLEVRAGEARQLGLQPGAQLEISNL